MPIKKIGGGNFVLDVAIGSSVRTHSSHGLLGFHHPVTATKKPSILFSFQNTPYVLHVYITGSRNSGQTPLFWLPKENTTAGYRVSHYKGNHTWVSKWCVSRADDIHLHLYVWPKFDLILTQSLLGQARGASPSE